LPKRKAANSVTVLKLTQITDLHLGSTQDFSCRKLKTYKTLKSVLAAIQRDGRGDDRLLLTGDIASNAQSEAYQLADQLLLSEEKKALWLPGNHDCMDLMQKNFKNFPFMPVFKANNWAIIMLDSSMPEQPGGIISKVELQRLEQYLSDMADKNILVAMHHSPVEVGSYWVDQHRIRNYQQLYQLLASHGKVKALINGHIHQQNETYWGDIPVYATPSTCFQFEPKAAEFTLGDQPPAYRWIELYDDGHVNTGVRFLTSFCDNAKA
jgi:Icc protein